MADYGRRSDKTSSEVKHNYSSKSRTRDKLPKDYYRHRADARTPPLHTRRPSVEELMKKRENLKRELNKYSNYQTFKHSNSHLKSKINNQPDDISKKRRNNSYEDRKEQDVKIIPERRKNFNAIDSEDEEKIIEKRREQRKKLIEKLNNSQTKECDTEPQHSNTVKNQDKEKRNELACHKNCEENNVLAPQKAAAKTTDMFAEDDFTLKSKPDVVTQDDNVQNVAQLRDNWDDEDGYYNVKIGDRIHNRYIIKNILGKGVFANVVLATDQKDTKDVAIKIIRQNDLIYKTSLKEIAFLKQVANADPEDKSHCIKLLTHFYHKNHLCLALEPLHMDLRNVIKKYGRNTGINLKALMSYSRQLLLALRFLKTLGVIHADIKPDNILINEKKSSLKLCDFGSATKLDDQDYTPYLVSRFYRAPEIILGIRLNYGVDIWAVACTMFEMATGKILFTGNSNNRMLKLFMELKGKFSTKLIKRGIFREQHFNHNNNFLLHKKDEYTGKDKVIEYPNICANRDLLFEIKKNAKNVSESEQKKILQLKDILEKMLNLDPFLRISVTDCLRHPFVQDVLEK